MKVIIKENYAQICSWAADYIINSIKSHENSSENNRPFVLGLPTGSTPLGVYQILVKKCKAGEVSFRNVVTFNMDEYVGLSEKDPESYHFFMMQNFFNHIDIPKENINLLNGVAPDLDLECRRYEEKIAKYGKVDLFLGGIGEDGHIAFNEPGSPLDSRTCIMKLLEETRAVNSRFFENNPAKVPAMALTVGVGTIFDAKEVLILASGAKKAASVSQSVKGPVSTQWPCSVLQNHHRATILCDTPAASLL